MNDILSKLKKMGLIIPSEKVKNTNIKSTYDLEKIFGGNWEEYKSGRVLIIKQSYDYSSQHGLIQFETFEPAAVFKLASIKSDSPKNLKDLVFLDIETSSLSFGAGSFVFLVGLCFHHSNEIVTKLLFSESPGNEQALLLALDNELSRFSVISTYNGKSFDIPFLRNRFKYHKIPFSSGSKNQLDLLHLARKIWKIRLEACKLADIERDIINFSRSKEETPGWLVPQIYFDFLDQKDPALLEGIFYHNRIDVLSLAAIFQYIYHLLGGHQKINNVEGIDLISLAKIFQKNKDLNLSTKYYQKGIKKGIASSNKLLTHRNIGLLKKKQQNWEEALHHWKISVSQKDYFSGIEIAKYYEHNKKDYINAKKWAEKALKIVNKAENSDQNSNLTLSIEHRINRIIRKIEKDEK